MRNPSDKARLFPALAILIAALCAPQAQAGESKQAAIEATYIKTRDDFRHGFETSTYSNDEDERALEVLKKQMKEVIGPVSIDGFPQESALNLGTLVVNEIAGDNVDGLVFYSPANETLFVTTDGLLNSYVAAHPRLPKLLRDLSRSESLYTFSIGGDAAVTNFADIPVTAGKGQDLAYAFLGLTAQDIGPFVPEEIYVFVSSRKRVFLVSAPVRAKVGIAACKRVWDTYGKKSEKALTAYRDSDLKDEDAFNEHLREENKGFAAYTECYKEKTRNQPFFSALLKQAQSIVDRLHPR